MGDWGNRSSWDGDEFAVTAAGTAEQMPDVGVPDGYEACIRGHPDNTDKMYIGFTKAKAEAHTQPLGPDDCYTLKITNLNLIWVDSAVNGERIIYTVEQ